MSGLRNRLDFPGNMWYNICDKITQNPGTYRGKVCMAKKKRRAAALISAIMAAAMTFPAVPEKVIQ